MNFSDITKQIEYSTIEWKYFILPSTDGHFEVAQNQGCELIGRLEKVSIGDQMETTFEVKRRPFGDHFEDNWRPNIKLSVVSRIIGCNIFGLRKMALLFLYLPFCLQFAIFKKYIKPK